jgi:hypothetical protein
MVILFDKRCVFSLTVELVARALSNIRFEAVRRVELIKHSLSTHADRTGQGALAATQHMANMPGLLQQCSLRTVFETFAEVASRDLTVCWVK